MSNSYYAAVTEDNARDVAYQAELAGLSGSAEDIRALIAQIREAIDMEESVLADHPAEVQPEVHRRCHRAAEILRFGMEDVRGHLDLIVPDDT
jgi:hypothetical protein